MHRLQQHNKQNTMQFNQQKQQGKLSDKSMYSSQYSNHKKQQQTNQYQFVQELKRQNYQQQKKNKNIYDQIVETNKYFGYKLIQRNIHDYRQSIIVKQHQSLLKEESYLIKQLTKLQYIVNQNGSFDFLIDVWSKNKSNNNTCQEKIQSMNKSIIFIKKNIKEITNKIQSQDQNTQNTFLMHSKQYCQLKKNYQIALIKINMIETQKQLKYKAYEQQLQRLKQQNKELNSQKSQLSEKAIYFENKSRQLIKQVDKLQNQLEQQKLISQRKINTQQQIQHALLDQSDISSIYYHNSSMVSQDQKQNTLSQLINMQQQVTNLHQFSRTSTKKKRMPNNRNIKFSGCKNRELFPRSQSQLQNVQQKSMRFIRRK